MGTLVLCAALLPAASSAAPPGVPAPPWFEQAITAGTLAPGSNCDWATRPLQTVVGYEWVLPSNFDPPDGGSTLPAIYANLNPPGGPAPSCRRQLGSGAGSELYCAAVYESPGGAGGSFNFDAGCSVGGTAGCERRYIEQNVGGTTFFAEDRGSLDCAFASIRTCKKGKLKKVKTKSGKVKRKCLKKGRGR